MLAKSLQKDRALHWFINFKMNEYVQRISIIMTILLFLAGETFEFYVKIFNIDWKIKIKIEKWNGNK